MATTKKAAKRTAATTATVTVVNNAAAPSVENVAKQAYITSAHAHLAQLKANIGDALYVGNYITGNRSQAHDRLGNPLPAGCSLVNSDIRSSYYGENVTLLGIDGNGNVVVRSLNNERQQPQALPYNFLRRADTSGASEVRRESLKLNDSYTGTVLGKGDDIAVGCQRFKTEKLRALLALADKTRTTIASKPAAAPAFNLTTRAATYTPVAAAVAKKAVKKVAKKSPAKKVAKKATKR